MVKTHPILSLNKTLQEDKGVGSHQRFPDEYIPVSVYVTGIDVVRPLQASDWLEADAGGFIGHDVDQSVLEFVARQVGCHKPGRVGFGISQSLEGGRRVFIFLNIKLDSGTKNDFWVLFTLQTASMPII